MRVLSRPQSVFKSRLYTTQDQNATSQILRDRSDARKRIAKLAHAPQRLATIQSSTSKPEMLLGKSNQFTPIHHWYEKRVDLAHPSIAHADSVFLKANLQDKCFHIGKYGKLTLYPTGDLVYTPTSNVSDDYFEFTAVDNRDIMVGFKVRIVCEDSLWNTLSISGPPGSDHDIEHFETSVSGTYGTFHFDQKGYDYKVEIGSVPQFGMDMFSCYDKQVLICFVSDDHYPVPISLSGELADTNGVGGDFRVLGDNMYYMPTKITMGMVVDTYHNTSNIVHILRCSYPPKPAITTHTEHDHVTLMTTNDVARSECDLIIQEYRESKWKTIVVCQSQRYTTTKQPKFVRVLFRHRAMQLTGPPSDLIPLDTNLTGSTTTAF